MRIWNDLTQFEPTDDSATYGSPSINDIKNAGTSIASNGLIPWSTWDKNFSSSRGFFDQIKSDNIRLMISLRNTVNNNSSGWMQNNPPSTAADWNEWWEHVFAQAYWLNVRNNYHVDDWEVFNEPDNSGQGWKGTTQDYETFVQYTSDALRYLYQTFLPGRNPYIYTSALSYPQAPANGASGNWEDHVFSTVGNDFNGVSYHYYHTGAELSNGINIAHAQANNGGHSDYPVWLTEWGSYDNGTYNIGNGNSHCNSDPACAVEQIDGLIRGSQPGDHYLYGSEYYVWSANDYGDSVFDGSGNARTVYYALRLGVRALQGGKPTYQSTPSTGDLNSITTKDSDGSLYLLTTNTSGTNYNVDEDVSTLFAGSSGTTIYRYDSNNADTSASGPNVNNGHVSFSIPANGAVLIKIPSGGNSGGGSVALNRSGWTASASATDTAEWASRAIDGDLTTRWSTGHSMHNGDWFQLDLGSQQTFNKVVLDVSNSPTGYPRGYQLFVSNDGSNWGNALTSGSGSGAVTTITFNTQNARYIRIVETQSAGDWWSIDEANVYAPSGSGSGGGSGPINRSGWTASASATDTAEWASRAIDGDLTTRWSTGHSMHNGDWFQVDMGSAQTVSKVVLDVSNSPSGYPRGYQLFVSNDGSNWGNALASGNGSGAVTTITFATQNARYIRIVETQSAGDWWSIDEFNAYA